MKFDILTLFPEMFKSFITTSIIKRAISNDLIEINLVNIRDFSLDKHKKVDDYSYGGGPGMIMTPQPIYDAFKNIKSQTSEDPPFIFLSPQGRVFNQNIALEFSKHSHLILLCGHYEGVDQRIVDEIITHEISIGDFILTGGEIPAMVVIDTISRLIPKVLGNNESIYQDTFSDGLLKYPQYTRPYNFMEKKVPEILLSGNHKEIEEWRRFKSLLNTKEKRPDLFNKLKLNAKDNDLLFKYNKYNKIQD